MQNNPQTTTIHKPQSSTKHLNIINPKQQTTKANKVKITPKQTNQSTQNKPQPNQSTNTTSSKSTNNKITHQKQFQTKNIQVKPKGGNQIQSQSINSTNKQWMLVVYTIKANKQAINHSLNKVIKQTNHYQVQHLTGKHPKHKIKTTNSTNH